MNAFEIEKDEREFEQMLDECHDEVVVFGITFGAGRALKSLDPIAFRCAMSDEPIKYGCSECTEEHDDETEANECCQTESEPTQ